MYGTSSDGLVPIGDEVSPAPVVAPNKSAQLFATERSARALLCKHDSRYRIPTQAQKKALLIGFAMCGKALAGAAFDAVRLESDVNLDDCDEIAAKNHDIVLIEIKSCGQDKIGDDLSGYFFNITSAELLIAQSLKDQYRFVFLNTVRAELRELTISEIWSRAKAVYPAFHIRF